MKARIHHLSFLQSIFLIMLVMAPELLAYQFDFVHNNSYFLHKGSDADAQVAAGRDKKFAIPTVGTDAGGATYDLRGKYFRVFTLGDIATLSDEIERPYNATMVFTTNDNISSFLARSQDRLVKANNTKIPVTSLTDRSYFTKYSATQIDIDSDFFVPHESDTSNAKGVIIKVPATANYFWTSPEDTDFNNNKDKGARALIDFQVIATNQRPRFKWEQTNVSFDEANGKATLWIRRDQGAGYACRLKIQSSNGSAKDSDYTGIDEIRDIEPSEGVDGNLIKVEIPINANDGLYELTENFQVTISTIATNNPNEALVHQNVATVTINNSTPKPVATFALVNDELTEGQEAKLRISLTGSTLAFTHTFEVGSISNTASKLDDIDFPAGSEATFTGSEDTETPQVIEISVPIVDDTIPEDDETLTFHLGASSYIDTTQFQISNAANHPVLTILDNEFRPTLSFKTIEQQVAESAGSASVKITLNQATSYPITLPLSYSGIASQGTDYTPQTSIEIPANTDEVTLAIAINEDSAREIQETIIIQMGTPNFAEVDPDASSHVIKIDDNDITDAEENVIPASKPTISGSVNITPSGIIGSIPIATWRIKGESHWRQGGASAAHLAPGKHIIEFRPLLGYVTPPEFAVTVDASGGVTFPGGAPPSPNYQNINAQTGYLSISILPTDISDPSVAESDRAQWKFEGEDDSSWRNSGTRADNVPAGLQTIVLKNVTGFTSTGTRQVFISGSSTAENPTTTTAVYSQDNATGGRPLPLDPVEGSAPEDPHPTNSEPHEFCGQLSASTGFSSGTAVRQKVVLTVAHALFDDRTLSYATDVRWYHQRHRGEYHPGINEDQTLPQPESVTPRGWYIMAGYSDEQVSIQLSGSFISPGVSTQAAQNLDVGAAFFSQDVARGGKAGILESTTTPSEWLNASSTKTLVGYPLANIPAQDRGKMHASPPTALTFTHRHASVYGSSDVISSPGMSGGGLFTNDSGVWRLSAIYMGDNAGQGLFHIIDDQVSEMIDNAETASNNTQFTDGAYVKTFTDDGFAGTTSIVITNLPQGAWKDAASTNGAWKSSGDELISVANKPVIAEFAPLNGWITPPYQIIADTDANTSTTYYGIYTPATPMGDTDGDGTIDLIESAFNMGINQTGTHNLEPGTGTSGMPSVRIDTSSSEPNTLVIEYIRMKSSKYKYTPQFGDSPGIADSTPPSSETITPIDELWERVIVKDNSVAEPRTHRFGWVKVELTD